MTKYVDIVVIGYGLSGLVASDIFIKNNMDVFIVDNDCEGLGWAWSTDNRYQFENQNYAYRPPGQTKIPRIGGILFIPQRI